MMLHRMWVQAPDSRSFPGESKGWLLRPAESLGSQGVINLYVDIFCNEGEIQTVVTMIAMEESRKHQGLAATLNCDHCPAHSFCV